MDKTYSAKTCPECESCEITTFGESGKHKRVYVCTNPICLVKKDCNTIYEVAFVDMQIPLKSPVG